MSFIKNAQQKIAHTSLTSLGNRDLRSLQDILNTEKEFVKTNAKSAADFQKSADAIKIWGEGEGEDLADICSKMSTILSHYQSAQTRFSSHLSTMRMHFKSIRTREEALADLKSRKRSLGNRIEAAEKKLAKMGPENKDLMKSTQQLKEYRAEMESMHIEVRNEEAAIGDFKRRTTKEALGIKCGGLLEMAEKLTIIADIGKLMIEEVPLETTPPGMPRAPYNGYDKTNQLLQEAARCVADVGFAPSANPNALPHHFINPGAGGGAADDSLYGNGQPDYARDGDGGTTYHDTDGYTGGAGAYGAQDGAPGPSGLAENGQYGHQQQASTDTQTTTPLFAKLNTSSRQEDWNSGRPSGGYPDPNTHTPNPEVQQQREQQARDAHNQQPLLNTRRESNPAADDWARSAEAAVVGAGDDAGDSSLNRTTTRNSEGVDDNDDSAYFASIGSTRAAQAAVRRPLGSVGPSERASSPPQSPLSPSINGSNTRWSGVPTVATVATTSKAAPIRVAPPSAASAGAAAGYDSGRTTTAAAFRRGFARNPSGTGIPKAPSSDSLAGPGAGSVAGSASAADDSAVQPLAIRKRNSVVPSDSPDASHNNHLTAVDGVADAAPPYAPSETGQDTPSLLTAGMPGGLAGSGGGGGGMRPPSPDNNEMRASVYGGIGEGGAADIAPEALYGNSQQPAYHDPYASHAPPAPPVQPWAQSGYAGPGSRPGSRPGSAAGTRPLPGTAGAPQAGHYPSYPSHQAQGGW